VHAGNEFYLNSLSSKYQLSFSSDFASVMNQIEAEYQAQNGITDGCNASGFTSSSDKYLVRNWQDILAIYVLRQSKRGASSYVLDASAKEELAQIFAAMNPVVTADGKTGYANYHIDDYIERRSLTGEDVQLLKK
jgi:hypothetical protein